MSMSDMIKKCRKAKGLTQEELGDLLGVQKSAVSKWERGRVENIKRSTIAQMANIFGVDPVELLAYRESSLETLTADESDLLALFRQLNAEGRQNLLDHAELLAGSDRYIKSDMAEAEIG